MSDEKITSLAISRKKGESVLIGDNIRVTVIQAAKTVRLLIEAPESVKILREELVKCDSKLT